LNSRGEYLRSEHFEFSADVTQKETRINSLFTELHNLYNKKKPILEDDLERELYKEESYLFVNEHDLIFNDVSKKWYPAKYKYLTTEIHIDTLPGALDALNTVHAFIREMERTGKSSIAPLKELGAKIKARSYHKLSDWDFPDGASIDKNEQTVDNHIHELTGLSNVKVEKHQDDVEREKYKEETQLLVNEHNLVYQEFTAWYNEKHDYLTHKEDINTLPEALTALNFLNSYIRENERYDSTFVATLKQLGHKINDRAYHGLTHWDFPNKSAIDKVESDVDSHLAELHELCNQKRVVLEDDKRREEEKERLRLLFASQASNFKAYENEVVNAAVVTHFGFSLKEVENFNHELEKIDSTIHSDVSNKRSDYEDTTRQLEGFHVTDNVYTNLSVNDLQKSESRMNECMQSRRQRYEAELERQRYNDQLCQRFAQLIDPLFQFIADGKEAITTSKGSLEQQLELVLHKLSTREEDGKGLDKIRELSAEMDKRKITHNEHTSLTVKDIDVQWEQYKLFLQNKEKQIRDEIELEKLRGLTPEDLREIEDNFKLYDKNQNGYLETSELKTCLYSLGEERSKANIEELITKFGDGKKLLYEQFFELMVQVLGDSDTLEEVILGFKLINRTQDGAPPVAIPAKLSQVMEDQFIAYIMETGHTLEDGIDFVQWTEQIFSR